MAGCVCAVEFADGPVGGGDGGVGYERCAGGATGAVETEGEGRYGGYAGEEVLVGDFSRVWWGRLGERYFEIIFCEVVVEIVNAKSGSC